MKKKRVHKPESYPDAKLYTVITILGYKVPIFLAKKLGTAKAKNIGEFHPNVMQIYIQKGLQQDLMADTIWHEIKHAIDRITLVGGDRLNERQVNTLSTVELDILRRNPKLRKKLGL